MAFTKTPLKPKGKAKWQLPMKVGKRGVLTFYLPDGELRERFIKLYPIHFNEKLMRWFGISHTTLHRFARKCGLKKDMKTIKKKHAAAVKRICEKNGYYESLRGKRPSEASMEATRKLRREGFVPILRLKEKDPRKYRRMIKQRSINMKRLIADERRRVLFGLPQKTKRRVTLTPMTSRMSIQKNIMIKTHNYFADKEHPTWVCYDSETNRSQRMESTAIRHGLKIIQADEE